MGDGAGRSTETVWRQRERAANMALGLGREAKGRTTMETALGERQRGRCYRDRFFGWSVECSRFAAAGEMPFSRGWKALVAVVLESDG